MYRRDESIGKDPSIVQKTENYDLPVRVLRSGKNKGRYKIPYGSHIYTCFSSDFFHPDADGSPVIRHVSVGGESGPGSRICDYAWVEQIHEQCVENGITFYYHQTGGRLKKDGKLYRIPRSLQHIQAHKAGLDVK